MNRLLVINILRYSANLSGGLSGILTGQTDVHTCKTHHRLIRINP